MHESSPQHVMEILQQKSWQISDHMSQSLAKAKWLRSRSEGEVDERRRLGPYRASKIVWCIRLELGSLLAAWTYSGAVRSSLEQLARSIHLH